jgi:hypothetical protein
MLTHCYCFLALLFKPQGRSSTFLQTVCKLLPTYKTILKKKTPWSESASELYRPSDRRLSAKRLPTFVDKGCHVVSVTDPYGRILGFLDRSRYFSIKWLLSCTHEAEWTPFQTPLLFFLYCRESNPGLRICSQELWPLDHRGGLQDDTSQKNVFFRAPSVRNPNPN